MFRVKTPDGLTIIEGPGTYRKKPSTYLGGAEAIDQVHLLVRLAITSALAPAGPPPTRIETILHPDNCVTVIDDGPGIPVDLVGTVAPRPRLDYVMCGEIHGEADPTRWGQLVTGGRVLSALSERLLVRTARDGLEYRAVFSRGLYVTLLTHIGTSAESGTRLVFRPDPDVFGDAALQATRVSSIVSALQDEQREIELTFRREDKPPSWF